MQADTKPPEQQPAPQHRSVRWGHISLLFIGTVLVALTAAGTWLLNSPDRIRALTERAVTSLTGRSLTLSGAFSFQLGREITIRAEQLSWANAAWSTGPAMLSVSQAEVAVDVRSILQPPLRITQVAADDVQLHFEWNADGVSNWKLKAAQMPSNGEPKQAFQWLLQQAELRNIKLDVHRPDQADELQIQMQQLKQRQSSEDIYPGQEMTIAVEGFSLANPAWANQRDRLVIETAEVTFDFDSILKPPLLLIDVAASDAQVDFEWDSTGRFNWQFNTDASALKETEHPLNVLLDKANLENIALRLQHPSQSEPVIIEIQQATQQRDDSNFLATNVDAIIAGKSANLRGRIGPFPELLSAGAVDYAIVLDGPNSNLKLLGKVEKLADLQKPNFEFDWSAPEVERVFEIFNVAPAAFGKAALRGFVITGDTGIKGQVDGAIGEFAVNGKLQARNITQLGNLSFKNLDGLVVDLKSAGPSARAAGRILTLDGLPPEPYELDLQVQDTAKGLQIEALRVATAGAVATGTGLLKNFPELNNLELDLQVNVQDISRFSGMLPGKKIPAQPLRIDGKIRGDSNNNNDSLTATIALGALQAKLTGELTENPRFADSFFDWTLQTPDAQKSGAIFDIKLLQRVSLDASGKAKVNAANLSLRGTVVKLGTHTAKLEGELPLSGDNAAVQLKSNVSGSNLGNLVNLFTATTQIPGLPYNFAAQLRYAGSKLELKSASGTVGSNTLKADGTFIFGKGWPATSLQLSTAGPRLEELLQAQSIEGLRTGAYSASGNLKLDSGGTKFSQFNVQTDSGVLRGSLALGWPTASERIDFDINADGTNLRKILPDIDGYEPAAAPFNITARGQLNRQQVDIPQLTGTLGSARINFKGHLDFSSALRSDGAALKMSGPRVSDLGRIKQWPLPEAPFDISATLDGAADKLNLSEFNLKYGPSDLRGSLQLTRGNKPRIEIIARSNRLDVRPFEELYFGDAPAAATATQAGQAKSTNKQEREKFIADLPLPLDQLKSIDGAMQLTAGKFISSRLPFDNLNVKALLADGNFEFDGSSEFSGNGNVRAALQLQQQQGRAPRVDFTITGRNVQYELNQLDQSLQGYNLVQNIDAYLAGDGANLREIAANVNGYLWLRGGSQKIATNQFDFLFGDFLTGVIEKINPFAKKDPYQTIRCVVAFFEATDGTLETSPAVLLSGEKVNIGAAGTINLETENIVMNVRADPRKGVGISASSLANPFVGLRGTLSKPELSLDPAGALVRGGAAYATMGLSLVAESLYQRWFKSKDPCKTLTNEAFNIRKKRDPAHVPAD